MTEGSQLDAKSLKIFATDPKKWSWRDIAADCAGFANARGGFIFFGIEDDADAPAPTQRIPPDLPDRLTKGISQHTTNVHVRPEVRIHANGGEYLVLEIVPSAKSIAATSDARYYLRVADETRRLMPDELVRLVAEKDSYQWETQTTRRVPAEQADPAQALRFLRDIRASSRVKDSVKHQSDAEILEHYFFVQDGLLTNLGILWIGRRADRAQLLHAPIVQFLKFDASGQRVAKRAWDDFSLNPAELIESVWTEIPDWREFTELPDGLFRKQIPHYDEVVERERIALGLIARHGSLTALEFGRLLQVEGDDRLRSWLGTLLEREIVVSRGRTRGTEYSVNPALLRSSKFTGKTTLKGIEMHRLKHLVLEDLAIHAPALDRPATRAEIHRRIGPEIHPQKLRRALGQLQLDGSIGSTGKRGRGGGYFLSHLPAK